MAIYMLLMFDIEHLMLTKILFPSVKSVGGTKIGFPYNCYDFIINSPRDSFKRGYLNLLHNTTLAPPI